jgi:hypothetical protein
MSKFKIFFQNWNKIAANERTTKRLISNETSQDSPLRLKDATISSAAKISNKMLQERSIRLKNAGKKSSKTSTESVSRLEKQDIESPESQNHRRTMGKKDHFGGHKSFLAKQYV